MFHAEKDILKQKQTSKSPVLFTQINCFLLSYEIDCFYTEAQTSHHCLQLKWFIIVLCFQKPSLAVARLSQLLGNSFSCQTT